jgi:hypothetical protein
MAPIVSTASRGNRAAARLVQHIVSGWRCQALHAAVKLGLPERLADAPQQAADLAVALDCQEDGLTRLLRALCALGVCSERPDGRFALSRAGRLLRADAGAEGTSLRALVQWWGGPLWPMWGELDYSVRTGRSARQKLSGTANYDFLEQNAEVAQVFHDAQRAMTALVLDDLARWPGWQSARTVVDVGGGHGELLLALLAVHPELRGTVFDMPHAEAGATLQIARRGLDQRCRFEPGSFFAQIPAGADRYVLKSILHNWDDARCADLLRACRAAAPLHATMLIIERVRPARLRPSARDESVARTDLNMLAGLGGRERSITEFAALLEAADFTPGDVTPLTFEFSVIEARVGRHALRSNVSR